MTNVIFSFDTEDYVNPHAADGILRVSRIVREAGFTPCHNLVARTAEALEKWGRQDVLDELKKCEIETHSLAHSYHPTINEPKRHASAKKTAKMIIHICTGIPPFCIQ